MDLKTAKPVHLKCPKCGYDFSVNTNRVEEDYRSAKMKITSIKHELAAAKEKGVHKNSPQWKRLIERLNDTEAQLTAIGKARKSLQDKTELEKYKIFYNLIKRELGADRALELVREAEDELIYNNYDTAIQKYTNFNGI